MTSAHALPEVCVTRGVFYCFPIAIEIKSGKISKEMSSRQTSRVRPAAQSAAVLTRATVRAGRFLGIAQGELAGIIGVSAATLSRLANGQKVLDPGSKPWQLAALLVRLFRSLDAIVGADAGVERAEQAHQQRRQLPWLGAGIEHLLTVGKTGECRCAHTDDSGQLTLSNPQKAPGAHGCARQDCCGLGRWTNSGCLPAAHFFRNLARFYFYCNREAVEDPSRHTYLWQRMRRCHAQMSCAGVMRRGRAQGSCAEVMRRGHAQRSCAEVVRMTSGKSPNTASARSGPPLVGTEMAWIPDPRRARRAGRVRRGSRSPRRWRSHPCRSSWRA